MTLIIRNGQIWYENKWFCGDVLIEEGIIKEINDEIVLAKGLHEEIDAKGKIVVPGLIDMHVHFREPGFEHKETIETGSKAALKGGFTTVAMMPNTNPVIDNRELVLFLKEQEKNLKLVKILPIGAITVGEEGEELTDFKELKESGIIALSDDGKGVQSLLLMKKAMEKAAQLKLSILAHCEDNSLAGKGVVHQGLVDKRLGVQGIPSSAEYLQVERDLLLAESTGCHYHVCHVSTSQSVELIRLAKAKGINVTAEVTPHHLLLTEEEILEPNPNFKMNPPLRSEKDRIELLNGLIDGTIDIIATDHAPHTELEKARGLTDAPFGIVGLETAFPLLYTRLVKTNNLKLEQLLNFLSKNPAKVFNLRGGRIGVGEVADLTIIDLNQKQTVDTSKFSSKGKNTPFVGWELYGWPSYTIVDGEIRWQQKGANENDKKES